MITSYKQIIGWFDFQDIYDMAVEKAADGDNMLEVGCFLGKSVAYLGEQILKSGKDIFVYALDLFEPQTPEHAGILGGEDMLTRFNENLTYLKNRGVMIITRKGKSNENIFQIPHKGFSFIFLDADHSYEMVKKDLQTWWPHIRKGGIFAGHDYGEETAGVKQAVDEFCAVTGLEMERSIASWIIRKP